MSTNSRPFFFNFLAAFRAHSGVQKVSPSATGAINGASLSSARGHQQAAAASTSASTSSSSSPQTNGTPSASRTITVKANSSSSSTQTPTAGATTVAVQQSSTHQFQPPRQHSTSPYSRSPASPSAFATSHHHNSSHNNTGRYHNTSRYTGGSSRQRRGSDSSSEGFRDTMGTEKWYIGGRTAAGEEKFYKLSMVKRPRSVDRLSLDRLSL
jgi:hypothetical protein